MKKLLCAMMATMMILSMGVGLTARAEGAPKVDTSRIINGNITLTLKSMEDLTWEELLKESKKTTSYEDWYINMLVEGINKTNYIEAYFMNYISYVLGGIKLREVDRSRLMEKMNKVIEIYNEYHELQLEMTTKILSEDYMQVDVKSSNLEDVADPVWKVGDLAYVKPDSTYYEGCEYFGVGKPGTMVPEDRIIKVVGVSYLNSVGRIESLSYKDGEDIEIWKKRMLLISDGNNLGWIFPTRLKALNALGEGSQI